MNIFALNAGSSSLKFALFAIDAEGEQLLMRGAVERLGSDQAQITIAGREPVSVGAETPAQAVGQIFALLQSGKASDAAPLPDALVCRVVHGGGRFTAAALSTPEVLREIRALAPLAPLHNPAEADLIEAAQKALPDASVVAVFDTAFHHTLPPAAFTYALPAELTEKYALRRYGFHGVSHQFVSGELLRLLGKDAAGSALITCHLGNGSSVCAVRDGQSVDTSMGMTPLEGLMMGTRSGDVDPGLLLYLQREAKMTPEQLDQILNHESGLRGVSGLSADVRDLEQAAGGNEKAALALEIFARRVRKTIGAYAAALGKLDAIAFTGGIGEHSASVRERICRNLNLFGIAIDSAANQAANGDAPKRISAADSAVAVWVIPTDEERQMARETFALLAAT